VPEIRKVYLITNTKYATGDMLMNQFNNKKHGKKIILVQLIVHADHILNCLSEIKEFIRLVYTLDM